MLKDFGFRVYSSGFRVKRLTFQGSGCRVYMVKGLGFRV
jgi:hypothetical protein